MNQLSQRYVAENKIVNFPTIITVICHLMTLYALNPCEPLASNINRHIKVIFSSNASNSLGSGKEFLNRLILNRGLLLNSIYSQKTSSNTQLHTK